MLNNDVVEAGVIVILGSFQPLMQSLKILCMITLGVDMNLGVNTLQVQPLVQQFLHFCTSYIVHDLHPYCQQCLCTSKHSIRIVFSDQFDCHAGWMMNNDAQGLVGHTWLVSITDEDEIMVDRFVVDADLGSMAHRFTRWEFLYFCTLGIFHYLHPDRQRYCCCCCSLKHSVWSLFSLFSLIVKLAECRTTMLEG